MTNPGPEIRRLSDEYTELTGIAAFSGVSGSTYYFDAGYLDSGAEALGYMRERLLAARSGQPEPCIYPAGPCPHIPEHTRHRGE